MQVSISVSRKMARRQDVLRPSSSLFLRPAVRGVERLPAFKLSTACSKLCHRQFLTADRLGAPSKPVRRVPGEGAGGEEGGNLGRARASGQISLRVANAVSALKLATVFSKVCHRQCLTTDRVGMRSKPVTSSAAESVCKLVS